MLFLDEFFKWFSEEEKKSGEIGETMFEQFDSRKFKIQENWMLIFILKQVNLLLPVMQIPLAVK